MFTYHDYSTLLSIIKSKGYRICNYHNWQLEKKCCILRHDIDYDIKKALTFANIEAEMDVKSTYFVLVTTDFYNVFSRENLNLLKSISKLGHSIGLHFDEMNYPDIIGNHKEIVEKIQQEAKVLEEVIDIPIKSVSMHRPSKEILGANLEIQGIVNSYSNVFFNDFKYLSDSRRRWREPVEEIIRSQEYDRLHILTHAFWYHEKEQSLSETLRCFIERSSIDRYSILNNNFSDLEQAIK